MIQEQACSSYIAPWDSRQAHLFTLPMRNVLHSADQIPTKPLTLLRRDGCNGVEIVRGFLEIRVICLFRLDRLNQSNPVCQRTYFTQ